MLKKTFVKLLRLSFISLSLMFLSVLSGQAQAPNCSSATYSSGGGYTITVCITAPTDGTTISGVTPVTATVSVSGSGPRVNWVDFYLDSPPNNYLLRDYLVTPSNVYTFLLPSAHFKDGLHTLTFEPLMVGETAASNRVTVDLIFSNGVTQSPVNTNQFTPRISSVPPGQPLVLAAVGDGASGETPSVPPLIASWSPNTFLYLGDVYEKGTYTEYFNWYGINTSFGTLASITNPVIGNHEYGNGSPDDYFFYWDNVPNYYSYNAGGWHFIALNSNANSSFKPTDMADQVNWLQNDLQNNTAACTLAYFHHPIYSLGPQGNTGSRLAPIWLLLQRYHADVVLTGHDHSYQRWKPLDYDGNVDLQNGITSFVVGNGGHGIQSLVSSPRPGDLPLTSLAAKSDSPTIASMGALKMLLYPTAASFQFINTSGTVLDSGAIGCHNAPDDATPPSVPNLNVSIDSSGHPTLNWSESTDDILVSGYTLYRDAQVLTTTNAATLSYMDTSVALGTTYYYTVDAVDTSSHHSNPSNTVWAMIPSQLTFQFTPAADAMVNFVNQTTKYGTAISVQADASPTVNSYLRFNVHDISGPITSATLRIYANTGLDGTKGVVSIHRVADNTWSETGINYANAPLFDSMLFPLLPTTITANTWLSADVTALVTGNGAVSFALTSSNNTAVAFSSREGANAPQLLIMVGSSTPTPTPVTPTATTPTAVTPTATTTTPTPVTPTATTTTPTPTDPPTPTTLSFNPEMDTWVNASTTTTNYAHSITLQADASPVVNSYLRFNVSGVSGTITSATLRLYAKTSLTNGNNNLNIHSVADTTWVDSSMYPSNQPAFGSTLFPLSPAKFSGGIWLSADVTPLVTGNGRVSFALTSSNNTAVSFVSLDDANGLLHPQLVLVVGQSPTPVTPTATTPTATTPVTPTATTPTDTPVTPTATTPTAITPTDTPVTPTATTPTPTPTDPPTPTTLSFNPEMDTWVNASTTTTNYAHSITLQADASPVVNSYLRFNVSGVSGTITSATLRLYAKTSLTNGNNNLNIHSVADTTWVDSSMYPSNQPAFGSTLFPLSPAKFSGGIWLSADVTPLVTGNGRVSFALTSSNNTAVSFVSLDDANGLLHPQLVLVVGQSPTPVTPTATTPTPTDTPTFTVTPTNTPTFTLSPTVTSTFTVTPTDTFTPSNTPTLTATMPTTVQVWVESDDANVAHSPGWIAESQPEGASGGSYLINSTPDDNLAIAFQGTQIVIDYVQGPSFGTFAVELDGTVVQQVSSNVPVYEFNDQFTLGGLSNSSHLLRVFPVQGVIAIDAFVVQGTVEAAPVLTLPTPVTPTLTPTNTDTALPSATSTPEVTASSTPIPLILPAVATMDDGAPGWQGTSGWTLISEAAYGGSGLSWQLVTSTSLETLRWASSIDLRNVLPTQSIQLSFASRLQMISGSAQVEVSEDGGNHWLTVASVTSSDDWSNPTVDLTALRGQVIELQFVWEPDSVANSIDAPTRWGMDQVRIQVAELPAATGTPTATLTSTAIITDTPTLTDTPTDTSTLTPTIMPTDTPTDSPTLTPTNTPTNVATPTPTAPPASTEAS